ncbi:hypothetical protein C5D34_09995 [Rathayibacter sp. AY1B1]|uniref:hypothetical protein n=1 Tax=unclassified Rathayibacter TaxID=2609250 RepID=UPI000CE8203E|nr:MULTISPECIES: hypothetical protein [unclassified Rathayibacter]PPI21780.1 hypothetical protein C5D08_06440 [Rathayibacter sp. AY1B6]PPI34264.1 hypothetical protein C5D34_09995 [Rathayibacter sp. AY1B1]
MHTESTTALAPPAEWQDGMTPTAVTDVQIVLDEVKGLYAEAVGHGDVEAVSQFEAILIGAE